MDGHKMSMQEFDMFVKTHQKLVYGFACAFLNDAHFAEDITQEVFIRIHKHKTNIKEIINPRAWLYTLTKNICIDWKRKHKRKFLSISSIPEEKLIQSVKTDETFERLQRILQGLKEDHKLILILKHVEGFSYKEIAEILKITPSSVGERLHRVRQMVIERLEGEKHELS
jgi:RNA polymerase sigma-70 factor (ECF subfamily)